MESPAPWIQHPVILTGEKVILQPLTEDYFQKLTEASSEDIIWTYMPVKGSNPEMLLGALTEALHKRDLAEQYPFVVIEKASGRVMGSTRFLQLNETHRSLEIGYTWYQTEYWGKGFNEECKYLLLQYSFEILKTIRVQIITSDKNVRSKRAIERIGGIPEGVLRNIILRNGEKKSIAYYSILEEEWPEVKKHLRQLISEKYGRI